jgi:hypothetical protein
LRLLSASALLVVALAGPAAAQPGAVVDHRGPGDAAQWTVGGTVSSTGFHSLHNVGRGKDLGGSASRLRWEDTPPGQGHVFFDNCTRPGEEIYGSDLVAMRFGGEFVGPGSDSRVLRPLASGFHRG